MSLLAAMLLSAPAMLPPEPPAEDKIPVLLITGANNHWWQWTHLELVKILEESGKFEVTVTTDPETALATGDLSRYRAFVLDYNRRERWSREAEGRFLEHVADGTGVALVHAADNAFEGWEEYEKLAALCWREGTGHGRFHSFDVKVTDRDHPITRDMPDLVGHPDELYHKLVHMHDTDYRVLATAHSSKESGGTGEDEPMVVVKEYGQGRIFHNILGHAWPGVEGSKISFQNPQFRDLMVRGTEWAATGEVSSPQERRPNALTEAERAAGWELLFDGERAHGFRRFKGDAFPEKGWAIEDGAIHKVAGAGGGDIVTRREYKDFEFAFEWKVAERANSGVIYRVSEDFESTWNTGPEYQIFDDVGHGFAPDSKTGAGALYALVAAEGKHLAPVGEFNTGRILVVGDRVEHWLNGVRVASFVMHDQRWDEMVKNSKFGAMPAFGTMDSGHIALQDHGNDVWFRNLKIRDLTAREDRMRPLFNGKDLEGWTHFLRDEGKPEDVWSTTEDGVLVCLGRPIGYIRTEADYDNFVLKLNWRFNPVTKQAGNSGVLMRKIGEDKVWPRSIEAQLMSEQAGDFWNIGEFPMKTVAERTNGRKTRRTSTNENPIGEWNEYEITVWKGDVVLRVNGKILNQAWGCMEIPGKLCLQSEGAEIHFRDVRLMPLR